MNSDLLFNLLIALIVIVFIIETLLDILNARYNDRVIPDEVNDVYSKEEYKESIAYKEANFKFKLLSSVISLLAMLIFFFLDGFAWVDRLARSISDDSMIVGLLFFGIITIGLDIVSIPADYYSIFVIEEKFGFNKTSRTTFFIDRLKNIFITMIIGGLLLTSIIWFYEVTGKDFWLYAWGIITIFTLFTTMFYTRIIVPLFNIQTPLEEGPLRDTIKEYSKKVGFGLTDIFVIDGSKRSTKANAYFSGLGAEKRITLYDTLIQDLDNEEIVSVIAHEVGHYKKNHVIYNFLLSIVLTGMMLWFLSLFIHNPLLSVALNINIPSFHVGLVVFGILYSPISEVIGLLSNIVSRKFEYQADQYAKDTYDSNALIRSLKKLSKNNLTDLSPHPAKVFIHYSHPTLVQRIRRLNS